MSLSWMAWKPRIDEPSNPSPSVKSFSPNMDAGTEKCCHVPGRSVKRRSTIWMFFSLMRSITLFASRGGVVVAIPGVLLLFSKGCGGCVLYRGRIGDVGVSGYGDSVRIVLWGIWIDWLMAWCSSVADTTVGGVL